MNQKLKYILIALGLILLFVLIFQPFKVGVKVATPNPGPTVSPTSLVIPTPSPLTYKGVEGKTALELLQSAAQVEASGEGANTFVTAINGYKPDTKHAFWAFYVNGQQAQVGAGSYVTKDTDTIEWRLEEIK